MKTFMHDRLVFDVIEKGSGRELVVLLHGFPANAGSWNPIAEILARNSYRVLALQQRGYSPNAQPKRRNDYQLDKLTGDVLALIIASGAERAHIVGHDWGGAIAWAFASKYPERVSSLSVISSPHPKALFRSLWHSKQVFLSWYLFFFQLPYIPELVITKNKGRVLTKSLTDTGLNQHSAHLYTERILDNHNLTYAMNWYRAIPFSIAEIQKIDIITPPTLFVYGENDKYLSAKAAQLTQEYVAGEYELKHLMDQSHWIPEESPELLAETILTFLSQRKY